MGGGEEPIFLYSFILYIIILLDLSVFGHFFKSMRFLSIFCWSFCLPSYWIWRFVLSSMNRSGDDQIYSFEWRSNSNYEDLCLFVRWHFGVDEDFFWKASFGSLFMFRGVPYGYLSLISPYFFKVFPYIIRFLMDVVYIFSTFVYSLKYYFILIIMFELFY